MFHHLACAFLPYSVFGGAAVMHLAAERWVYDRPLGLLVAGNFAVCIFFVLSGYVLSHKFFVTGDPLRARLGATKRYFRLMPPILASILLVYVALKLGLAAHHQAAEVSASLWLERLWPVPAGLKEALWQGIWGVLSGQANPNVFNNALWTMKIEFFGSFLVFAFALFFGGLRRRWVAYAVLFVAFWNSFYLAFLIGLALCDISVHRPKLKAHRVTSGLLLLAGLVMGAAPNADSTQHTHVLGAGFVMAAVIFSPWLKRSLSVWPARYLGKISFSLYLTHILIIGSLTSLAFAQLSTHVSYLPALAAAVALSVPAFWLAAHLFTRFVDEPSVRLANKINARWFSS